MPPVDRIPERIVADERLLPFPVVVVRAAEQDADAEVDLDEIGRHELAVDDDAGRDEHLLAPVRHVLVLEVADVRILEGAPAAEQDAALAGLVDIDGLKATGRSIKIDLPKSATRPEVSFEWKIPKWSNTIERDRARTYFQAYACAAALHFVQKALDEVRRGNTKTWEPFTVPQDGIGCGFTEAVRGVLSHHLVIRDGKIANYHPYPPTPWNANPRDVYGTAGPYEDAVQGSPIFEENPPDRFKGIDVMRTVRSFDPCLPCGVHMTLPTGKVLQKIHSPAMLNPA
jgi:hydrogenase large subunit